MLRLRAQSILLAVALVGFLSCATFAQQGTSPGIRTVRPDSSRFHPTFDMGSGSVARYFYSQEPGSYWKMKIVEKYYDENNKVLSSDSMWSSEQVVSNAMKSLQGLPVVECEARSWRGDDTAHADSRTDEYYVDDSLIMTVMNHSTSNGENHILLVAPIRMGASWLEKTGDSARCEIVSMHDTVSTAFGNFGNALVTVTKYGKIELAKYFVKDIGLVKTVMRMEGRRPGDANVITSELVDLRLFRQPVIAPEDTAK